MNLLPHMSVQNENLAFASRSPYISIFKAPLFQTLFFSRSFFFPSEFSVLNLALAQQAI